jgi:hypothetical protein
MLAADPAAGGRARERALAIVEPRRVAATLAEIYS